MSNPPSKGIEITNKSGEPVDLKAIHSQNSSNSEVSTPTPVTSSSENNKDDEEISEAEKTRRLFIEQSKLRKAAIEQKKLEQQQKEQEAKIAHEQEVEKTNDSVLENMSLDDLKKELDKKMNVIEKLKLRKLIRKKEQELQPTTADSNTTNVETPSNKSEITTPNNESVTPSTLVDDAQAKTETENNTSSPKKQEQTPELNSNTETEKKSEDDGLMTMTNLLEMLQKAKPIEDIFTFKYPDGIENSDLKYKKNTVKYTYGPAFLAQFQERVNIKPDEQWIKDFGSKIVIPPGMGRNGGGRSRDNSGRFGPGSRSNSNADFRRSNSVRNMDSRNNSKRRSKRDNKGNRSGYVSRRDRERDGDDRQKADDKPKEEVAPLVPSANRWIPKSKQQKTEKKLAPDGETELLSAEEAEKKTKSLLNKLTLEKFDAISTKVLAIANQSQWEENGETLQIVIEQVFRKACDEPHWSSMYAQLCGKLVKELNTEIKDNTNENKVGPKLILHYLVVRCHTEFDKGWADKLPTNEDGTPLAPEMMSDEYYLIAAAKRRGLGLVRFIGHLYCLNLLTGKMMFECFRRLMKDMNDNPTEETLESVIELLNTVGAQFENDKFTAGNVSLDGSALLDSLFSLIENIVEEGKISNRIKFKLLDIKELRETNNWNNANKDEGPKTISQIHEEEERKRQEKAASAANSRANSRRNQSNRMPSRRDAPPPRSRDDFITTRSSSTRHSQRAPVQQQKEELKPTMSATNMFSALMDNDDDE